MNECRPQWVEDMNTHYQAGNPFLSVIGFDRDQGEVIRLNDCASQSVFFAVHDETNFQSAELTSIAPLTFTPPDYSKYATQFARVLKEIKNGNSYLLNLCTSSTITAPLDLWQVFLQAEAPYRLFYKNQFTCFSPERFITISNNTIRSNPMKGTIDARIEDAANKLRTDKKEIAEHYTIVDLIRNDAGIVCDKVDVTRFAYLEQVETNRGPILQMSSEIEGRLSAYYVDKLGELFYALLPAGSISGAPKKKTVDIIEEVESEPRGFYTGVMVYYNGETVDSAVLIRFLERTKSDDLIYRSGGGITHMSKCRKEYKEALKKVYLPFSE